MLYRDRRLGLPFGIIPSSFRTGNSVFVFAEMSATQLSCTHYQHRGPKPKDPQGNRLYGSTWTQVALWSISFSTLVWFSTKWVKKLFTSNFKVSYSCAVAGVAADVSKDRDAIRHLHWFDYLRKIRSGHDKRYSRTSRDCATRLVTVLWALGFGNGLFLFAYIPAAIKFRFVI